LPFTFLIPDGRAEVEHARRLVRELQDRRRQRRPSQLPPGRAAPERQRRQRFVSRSSCDPAVALDVTTGDAGAALGAEARRRRPRSGADHKRSDRRHERGPIVGRGRPVIPNVIVMSRPPGSPDGRANLHGCSAAEMIGNLMDQDAMVRSGPTPPFAQPSSPPRTSTRTGSRRSAGRGVIAGSGEVAGPFGFSRA